MSGGSLALQAGDLKALGVDLTIEVVDPLFQATDLVAEASDFGTRSLFSVS